MPEGIMARVRTIRSLSPAAAALAGRMKNYEGRTCGTISKYNHGRCRCPECREASRQAGIRRRRKRGVKPRYPEGI